MIDLISANNIESTRSKFYRYSGEVGGQFADYVIISPNIQVKSFVVLEDQVSDYLPLYVDFS